MHNDILRFCRFTARFVLSFFFFLCYEGVVKPGRGSSWWILFVFVMDFDGGGVVLGRAPLFGAICFVFGRIIEWVYSA